MSDLTLLILGAIVSFIFGCGCYVAVRDDS